MKAIETREMRAVEGGKHCTVCCIDVKWYQYPFHTVFDSVHIMGKKLGWKCKHA